MHGHKESNTLLQEINFALYGTNLLNICKPITYITHIQKSYVEDCLKTATVHFCKEKDIIVLIDFYYNDFIETVIFDISMQKGKGIDFYI